MIEKKDMEKLTKYFDRSSPEKLLDELFFSIVYYLGLRGREWIKGLRREQFKFEVDSRGRKYVTIQGIDSVQKNNQPSIGAPQTSKSVKEGRIYSIEGAIDRCPVRCLEIVFEKLPADCDKIFYKSQRNWANSSE